MRNSTRWPPFALQFLISAASSMLTLCPRTLRGGIGRFLKTGGTAEPGQVSIGDRGIVHHPRPGVMRESGQPSGETLIVFQLHAVIIRTGGIRIRSADAVILRHVAQEPVL